MKDAGAVDGIGKTVGEAMQLKSTQKGVKLTLAGEGLKVSALK